MDLGIRRAVGHRSAPTRVHVPPDDLIVSLVAVDEEPAQVVVESDVDGVIVPVVVLDAGQAASLAAGLLASAGSATPGVAASER